MLLLSGGDLNGLACKSDLSSDRILELVRQVAAGVEYLHYGWTKPIVHGDLKGANVFLTAGTPAIVRIGDLENFTILEAAKTNKSHLIIQPNNMNSVQTWNKSTNLPQTTKTSEILIVEIKFSHYFPLKLTALFIVANKYLQ